MTLRAPTSAEREAVASFLDGLDRGLAERLLGGRELGVVEAGPDRFAVLTTRGVLGLPAALRSGSDAGGLAIGVLGPNGFDLDLQGAVLVARHTQRSVVRVTEHASRLYLYGRNLLGSSITHHDEGLERGDACIVTNPRGEGMGLGTVVGRLKGDGEAVRPIHDLGTYLRDQGDGDEA